LWENGDETISIITNSYAFYDFQSVLKKYNECNPPPQKNNNNKSGRTTSIITLPSHNLAFEEAIMATIQKL